MYGYHTDTLYELRPTSCTDVLRRCVRIAPTYAVNNAPGTQYQAITIAELEILTGINFFPKMNSEQKAQKLSLPEPKPHKN